MPVWGRGIQTQTWGPKGRLTKIEKIGQNCEIRPWLGEKAIIFVSAGIFLAFFEAKHANCFMETRLGFLSHLGLEAKVFKVREGRRICWRSKGQPPLLPFPIKTSCRCTISIFLFDYLIGLSFDCLISYQRSTVQFTEYGSAQFHPLLSDCHHELVKHLLLVLICSVCMVVVRAE